MKFELDAYESAELAKWNTAHMRDHHNNVEPYGGAIGGRVSFIITQTSIGHLLSVKCNACRDIEAHLLTDALSL